jgi:hypothetical protein
MTQRNKWTAIPEVVVLEHKDMCRDYNVTFAFDDAAECIELRCANDIAIPVEDVEEFCDQLMSYLKALKEGGAFG